MDWLSFVIDAYWGPRSEAPPEIATRVLRMTEALGALDPLLASWWVADLVEQDYVPLVRVKPRLVQVVADRVYRDDFDEPEPSSGYRCDLRNVPHDRPDLLDVSVQAGVGRVPDRVSNVVTISTSRRLAADPRLVAYPLVKGLFRVMIETFGATAVSGSYYAQLVDPGFSGRLFRPAWMVYLSARNAARITPTPDVLTERTADGGLLMSATERSFDLDDPEHIAAARAISDALLSLNDRGSL